MRFRTEFPDRVHLLTPIQAADLKGYWHLACQKSGLEKQTMHRRGAGTQPAETRGQVTQWGWPSPVLAGAALQGQHMLGRPLASEHETAPRGSVMGGRRLHAHISFLGTAGRHDHFPSNCGMRGTLLDPPGTVLNSAMHAWLQFPG